MSSVELIAELTDICIRQAEIIKAQAFMLAQFGAAQNGNISVAHSATFEQREMARDAKLCVTGQSDGKLIISADGEMPDIDIPVVITLLG